MAEEKKKKPLFKNFKLPFSKKDDTDDAAQNRMVRAERLREREIKAYTSTKIVERITARSALAIERKAYGLLGTAGEAYRQAKRASTQKEARQIRSDYFKRVAANLVERKLGIIGEGFATKLRASIGITFGEDPDKAFTIIKDSLFSVREEFDKINTNLDVLNRKLTQSSMAFNNQIKERLAEFKDELGINKYTLDFSEMTTKTDRLSSDMRETESKLAAVEARVSMSDSVKNDKLKALEKSINEIRDQLKKNTGNDNDPSPPSAPKKKSRKKKEESGNSSSSVLDYIPGIGTAKKAAMAGVKKAMSKKAIAALMGGGIGATLLSGALEAADVFGLGDDDETPITKKKKSTTQEEYFENLNSQSPLGWLKNKLTGSTTQKQPQQKKSGLFGFGGFPSTGNPQPTFQDAINRDHTERMKSRFMSFGALPDGFEFLEGHRGRLGDPAAVAASGAMPFGGSGGSGGSGFGGSLGGRFGYSPPAGPGEAKNNQNINMDRFSGTLSEDRQKAFAKELENNPQLMRDLHTRAVNEVGKNPANQQLWLETLFNRAMFQGKSLEQTVNSRHRVGGYFPDASFKNTGASDKEVEQFANSVVQQGIMKGSNRTNMATDNASDQPGNPVASNRIRAGVTGQWMGEGKSQEFYYSSDAGKYKTRHGDLAKEYRERLKSIEGGENYPKQNYNSQPIEQEPPTKGPSKVIEAQAHLAKIRQLPIDPKLRKILEHASAQTGVYSEIYSGGQAGIGTSGKRTGSTRHDHGNAADLKLYVMENGKKRYLDFNNPNDRPHFEKYVEITAASGATGIGAGAGYMGTQSIHVGFGSEATWGGAEWLNGAFTKGRQAAKNGYQIPKQQNTSSAPGIASSLEKPFSKDELKQFKDQGGKIVDLDPNQKGFYDSLNEAKRLGLGTSVYDEGPGGGKAWAGDQNSPKWQERLVEKAKQAAQQGIGYVHIDNLSGMSADQLKGLVGQINSETGGKVKVLPKNNLGTLYDMLKKYPEMRDMVASNAIAEGWKDPKEIEAAKKLKKEFGIDAQFVGWSKDDKKGSGGMTEQDAAALAAQGVSVSRIEGTEDPKNNNGQGGFRTYGDKAQQYGPPAPVDTPTQVVRSPAQNSPNGSTPMDNAQDGPGTPTAVDTPTAPPKPAPADPSDVYSDIEVDKADAKTKAETAQSKVPAGSDTESAGYPRQARNNPETRGSEPGSGGYGAAGRCFI